MKLTTTLTVGVTLSLLASSAFAYDADWKRGRVYYRSVCTSCHAVTPIGSINPSTKTKAEWAASGDQTYNRVEADMVRLEGEIARAKANLNLATAEASQALKRVEAAVARQTAARHLRFVGGECSNAPGSKWGAKGMTPGEAGQAAEDAGTPKGGAQTQASNGAGSGPLGYPSDRPVVNEQVEGLPVRFSVTFVTGIGSVSMNGSATLTVRGSDATLTIDPKLDYDGPPATWRGPRVLHGTISGGIITGDHVTVTGRDAGDYTWDGVIAGGHGAGGFSCSSPSTDIKCTAKWNG